MNTELNARVKLDYFIFTIEKKQLHNFLRAAAMADVQQDIEVSDVPGYPSITDIKVKHNPLANAYLFMYFGEYKTKSLSIADAN